MQTPFQQQQQQRQRQQRPSHAAAAVDSQRLAVDSKGQLAPLAQAKADFVHQHPEYGYK
jgi:hypothetical protein